MLQTGYIEVEFLIEPVCGAATISYIGTGTGIVVQHKRRRFSFFDCYFPISLSEFHIHNLNRDKGIYPYISHNIIKYQSALSFFIS